MKANKDTIYRHDGRDIQLADVKMAAREYKINGKMITAGIKLHFKNGSKVVITFSSEAKMMQQLKKINSILDRIG